MTGTGALPPPLYPCGDNLAGIDPDALGRVSRELLARVVDIFGRLGVPLPHKHVWTLGTPVFDCEQVVVALTGLGEGFPVMGESVTRPCSIPIKATFTVSIVRCAPVGDSRGNMPSPDALGGAADATARDAFILMSAASCLDLFGAAEHPATSRQPWDPLGGMGVEASVQISEPSGGYQAAVLSLTTVIA